MRIEEELNVSDISTKSGSYFKKYLFCLIKTRKFRAILRSVLKHKFIIFVAVPWPFWKKFWQHSHGCVVDIVRFEGPLDNFCTTEYLMFSTGFRASEHTQLNCTVNKKTDALQKSTYMLAGEEVTSSEYVQNCPAKDLASWLGIGSSEKNKKNYWGSGCSCIVEERGLTVHNLQSIS
jgi:hypothetical protein